jgi:hypothetical protein
MATNIIIPDFNFAAFYYADILEALIQYKRIYVPELTEELDEEPFIQFLRAVALVGHLNNTILDLVANESTLGTAKLADTVREMFKLIDYDLSPATPSQVDIVYELSKVFNTSFLLIPENSKASIKREGDNPIITFEALDELEIERTDQFSYVYALEDSTYTNYTSEANSDTTPADDWSPWTTPVSKDCIYWGHKQVMWDKLSVYLTTASSNISGVFEFYDGEWRKADPSSVTIIGGGSSLYFDLTDYLGTQNRQGTLVRIQLNESSAYEDVYVVWTGSENVATTGLLGQSTPSTEIEDYSVGSDWTILDDVEDNSLDFTQDGDIDYTLPHTTIKNWVKTSINGLEAFWLRYRIIEVSTPTSPTFINTRMDEGKQYVIRLATQGLTHTDEPLGSSTGLPNQRFSISKENFVINSETVYVDDEAWTRVDNFLESKPNDKHYTVELTTNDRAVIVFGDAVTGKIPTLGVGNIDVTFRYGVQDNGNVGANTVTIDKAGLTFINKLWNPRQATGWSEAQGASESNLEKAKIEGPATLRIKDVAISASDVETLTLLYTDSDGAKPFSRAFAFEEGYGPKTIELVVVAKGGGSASSAQLENLQTYFNGDKYSYPPIESHIVANQQVITTNYIQKVIDLDLTIYGKDISETPILNSLQGIIQPEALKEDGMIWEWNFGVAITTSRIIHEVFSTDDSITKVVVNSPTSDVTLQTRELPVLGEVTITIIES